MIRLDHVVERHAGRAHEALGAKDRGEAEELRAVDRRGARGDLLRDRQAGYRYELEDALRGGVEALDARPQRVLQAKGPVPGPGAAPWRTSSSM